MSFWNPWREVRRLNAHLEVSRQLLASERLSNQSLVLALYDISICDTPRSNATVKRCVRIAKAALETWK
jgi:hypothetical protein